jgi:hypothetical protein
LSGEAADIAWFPSDSGDGGFLVQWLGVDDERLIEPVLRSTALKCLLESSTAELLEFETGFSGTMWLIDAAECGAELRGGHEVLPLNY